MLIVTTEEMKSAEQFADAHGITYEKLMANAGNAISSRLEQRYLTAPDGSPVSRRVVILCGSGNNGGDGFVIAARFANRGCKVTVVLCGNHLPNSPEAREMYRRMQGTSTRVLNLAERRSEVSLSLSHAELVVDAVFGTGFRGTLPLALQDLFEEAAQSKAVRVAVDMPSGVGEGEISAGAFCADETYIPQAVKQAHISSAAKRYCGRLIVVPIGIPDAAFHSTRYLVEKAQVKSMIPPRFADAHKGSYGKLCIVAGSRCYVGAAMLAASAALRSGVGICQVATLKENCLALCGHLPEATWLPLSENESGSISADSYHTLAPALKNCTAALIGCGMTQHEDTGILLDRILQTDTPLVIDADGINALAGHIDNVKSAAPRILTPHMGEMARISGYSIEELKRDPMGCAQEFATTYGVVLVLKDAVTVIASPDGEVYAHMGGNAGMARGGSGDTLAGIIASLLAQGLSAKDAAISGVYLHGAAGDKAAMAVGAVGMLPTDMISALPEVFKEL